MSNTKMVTIPMLLSHFYELAGELNLMTTSYGGEFVVAGRGAERIEWHGYTPEGKPLGTPFALVPPHLERAARQISGAQP